MDETSSRSKAAGVALAIGLWYILPSLSHYLWQISSSYASISMGATVARILLFPHLLSALIAIGMNFIGFMLRRNHFLLIASFFYTTAIVLLPHSSKSLIFPLSLLLIARLHTGEKDQMVEGTK